MSDPVFAKNKPIVTPKGVAVFPWLTRADTKFKEEGEYRTGLAVDPADPAVKAFVASIKEIQKEAVAACKAVSKKKFEIAPVFTKELDDQEAETGRILFRAKTSATRTGKDKRVVETPLKIVDAHKNKHPSSVPVYGGSLLKLVVSVVPRLVKGTLYLSLYIVAVQVLELVSSSGAEDMFDEEEGYTADAAAAAADSDAFDDADADAGDDEDEDEDEDDSDMY